VQLRRRTVSSVMRMAAFPARDPRPFRSYRSEPGP
jgi:hypothetical protein